MDLDVSKSVLVVDDSSTMIRLVCDMLQRIGFETIDVAQGGNTALAKLKANHYDLMISDWHMEPMSGLDLLWALRADPNHEDMPFFMMTAERTCPKAPSFFPPAAPARFSTTRWYARAPVRRRVRPARRKQP